MLVSNIRLKNWRNFQSLDLPLRDVTYVLGPNASGKSNLLDALRFLRDVGKHFTVNQMTAKDSVRSRIESEVAGRHCRAGWHF